MSFFKGLADADLPLRESQEQEWAGRKHLGIGKTLWLPAGLVQDAAVAYRQAEEARKNKEAEREAAEKAQAEKETLGGDPAGQQEIGVDENPFKSKDSLDAKLDATLLQAQSYTPDSMDVKVFPDSTLMFDHWQVNADRSDRKQQAKAMFHKMLRNNGFRRLHLLDLELAEHAFATLRNRFPNFVDAVDAVHDALTLAHAAACAEGTSFPAILLDGEPGIGKTHFAEELAKALSLPFNTISAGSIGGGFVLSGTDQHYVNAQPGRIWHALANADVCNPIIVLDELDKSGGDERWNFQDGLLPLLEPRTASAYEDVCLEAKLDASKIFFIATSNDATRISEPLRTRMHVISVPAPNEQQRLDIARAIFDEVVYEKVGVPIVRTMGAVEQLAALPVSPREMRKIVERTIARRLRSSGKDDEIVISEIEVPRIEARQKMGFV